MADRALKIHVLDVGHGDSLIVEFPGGTSYGIIDCHEYAPADGKGREECDRSEPKVLTFFRQVVEGTGKGKPVVEFVCLTHPHDDHYLGFPTLLRELGRMGVPIKRVWEFADCQQKTQAKLEAANRKKEREEQRKEQIANAEDLGEFFLAVSELLEKGSDWETLDRPLPELLRLGQVVIHAMAPSKKHVEDRASYERMSAEERKLYFRRKGKHAGRDVNILSSVLLISYGKSHVLLGGDLLNLGWKAILEDAKIKERHGEALGKCIALKVSHHGSDGANFPGAPKDPRPLCSHIGDLSSGLVAAISGGYREDLPGVKMLNAFRKAGTEVYCTGEIKGECRLYVPTGCSERAARRIRSEYAMAGTARVGFEVGEIDGSLHGNITIICDDSGGWTVETESGTLSL